MKNKIITSFLAVILLVVSVWSVSAQNQDDLLFRRRVVSSGVNSLFYGAALVAIIEPESECCNSRCSDRCSRSWCTGAGID